MLGEWGFRRLTLAVDARALIPRPETEIVVERCLALLDGVEAPRVLDVGTGSGAIALAIADEHPGARVTGIDVSPRPSRSRGRTPRARASRSSSRSTTSFDGLPAGPWQLVVSNPPYVDPDDRAALAPEVRDWEPASALFSRDAVGVVAQGAVPVLAAGGALVLEVGDDQASGRRGAARLAGVRRTSRSRRTWPDATGSSRDGGERRRGGDRGAPRRGGWR